MASVVICDNCGTENAPNVRFCKQCGTKMAEPVASAIAEQPAQPAWTATSSGPSTPSWPSTPSTPVRATAPNLAEKRYGALRGIAALCRLLGYISAGFTILGGLFYFLILTRDLFGFGALLLALIVAAVQYIAWRIVAESISVLLDIEENTRLTAHLLSERLS